MLLATVTATSGRSEPHSSSLPSMSSISISVLTALDQEPMILTCRAPSATMTEGTSTIPVIPLTCMLLSDQSTLLLVLVTSSGTHKFPLMKPMWTPSTLVWHLNVQSVRTSSSLLICEEKFSVVSALPDENSWLKIFSELVTRVFLTSTLLVWLTTFHQRSTSRI